MEQIKLPLKFRGDENDNVDWAWVKEKLREFYEIELDEINLQEMLAQSARQRVRRRR